MPMTKAAKPPYVPAATSMRERMAQAIWERALGGRLSWAALHPKFRKVIFRIADVALDCLTGPPSKTMVDEAIGSGNCGGWGHGDECYSGDPIAIWEVMVRTMIEEGK